MRKRGSSVEISLTLYKSAFYHAYFLITIFWPWLGIMRILRIPLSTRMLLYNSYSAAFSVPPIFPTALLLFFHPPCFSFINSFRFLSAILSSFRIPLRTHLLHFSFGGKDKGVGRHGQLIHLTAPGHCTSIDTKYVRCNPLSINGAYNA